MSPKSPARSAFGRALNPTQASICSTVKQLVQAGFNAEDILLSKASRLSHSSVSEFGHLHPRFRGNRISNQLSRKQASISCIRWTCPPKFILNDEWHVAAGDQSEERRVQKQRESGLIDLIYSHPSTIPSSPSISVDVDGHNIPIIPITPIEDDEADSSQEVEPLSSTKENVNIEVLMQPASQLDTSVATLKPCGMKTGLEADVGAAASAAFTALVKSNEQGSLIDTDLLIKILNNPKMIELLKDEEKMAIPKKENSYMMQPSLDRRLSSASRDPVKEDIIKRTSGILTMLASNTEIPSVPPSCLVPDMMLLLKQVCENQDKLLKQAHTSSDLMKFSSSADTAVPKSEQPLSQKVENDLRSSSFSTAALSGYSADRSSLSGKTKQPIWDDDYYYKSLVRQHGVDRQKVEGQKRNPAQFDSRLTLGASGNLSTHPQRQEHRKQKACIYFNSLKGCRLGLSCPYRHEFSSTQMRPHRVSEAPTAKRVKSTREIHLRL